MSENLSKANDLVVKDSPVDFNTHEFICIIHHYITEGYLLSVNFGCASALTQSKHHDEIENSEFIKTFHLLEKNLAFQNKFLEKLRARRCLRLAEEEKYTIELTREEIGALIDYCSRPLMTPSKPFSDDEKIDIIVMKLKEKLIEMRARNL